MKSVQSNVLFSQPLLVIITGLVNLVQKTEKAVNERLAHTPELYLLALAQFATTADTEVVSSPNNLNLSFVLSMC